MLLNWDLNNKDLHENYVKICDVQFEGYLDNIIDHLISFHDLKILTVAGPTSSGKTTVSMKIAEKLGERGITSKTISMDSFYRNNTEVPRKHDGTPNFEVIDAIDVDMLIKCLHEVIEYGKTALPVFNFLTGKREEKFENFELKNHEIVIIEGIHGLNPQIVDNFPKHNLRSIFISIEEKVYLDNGMIFSKRDIRFLRRLVRDYKYRGASPELTFKLWEGVIEGEDLFIFPFKNNAEIIINSFHQYELNVIKEQALTLLKQVDDSSEYFAKASELIERLKYIPYINEEYVASSSLIREFIGGSQYH